MIRNRLKFSERVKIQYEIENNAKASLASIAKTLERSPSSIYREIMLNRDCQGSTMYNFMKEKPLDCEFLKSFPYCCNVCEKKGRCVKFVYIYDAAYADYKAKTEIHSRNKKPKISKTEMDKIDKIVSPAIVLNKESLYDIKLKNSEISVSESTLRRYVNNGYLKAKSIDLPRTVQRVYKKEYSYVRNRINPRLLSNRTFDDYKKFIESHPNAVILEVDTVIGKRTDKKAVLTLFETKSKYQFGFIVRKNEDSVKDKVNSFITKLRENNAKFFDVILTDNGVEMLGLPSIQVTEDGELLFNLFFCDPYRSYQKGKCEKNHQFFRYFFSKGKTLDSIEQNELNQVFNQINSIKRKSLGGKSPKELFEKLYGTIILKLFE